MKIITIAWFVFLCLLIKLSAQNPKTWITNLPSHYDERFISQMTIPGTHNSGTKYVDKPALTQCQNTTVKEQLEGGIRFLDFKVKPIGGIVNGAYLAVYHEEADCHLRLDDAIKDMKEFLISNPQEFILMLLSNENCRAREVDILFERKYGETRSDGIEADSFFWMGTYIPKVNEIRGKIVLLRKFESIFTKGIHVNWKDNSIYCENIAPGGPCFIVQDRYHLEYSQATEKVNGGLNGNVSTLLEEASKNKTCCLYLNFCNIVGGFVFPGPGAAADRVNSYLERKFNESGHYGCVIMDMPRSELVRKIFMTNQ